MTPNRIVLLRHGESEANVDPAVYARVPDWRIALTANGVEQAQEAGRKIAGLIGSESFGVFSSPYVRTEQTKNAMLEGMGREPVFDYQGTTLREQEYDNMPPAVSHGTDIKCFLARWYHWSIECLESIDQLPNCHVSVMGLIGNSYNLEEPFSTTKVLKQNGTRRS